MGARQTLHNTHKVVWYPEYASAPGYCPPTQSVEVIGSLVLILPYWLTNCQHVISKLTTFNRPPLMCLIVFLKTLMTQSTLHDKLLERLIQAMMQPYHTVCMLLPCCCVTPGATAAAGGSSGLPDNTLEQGRVFFMYK